MDQRDSFHSHIVMTITTNSPNLASNLAYAGVKLHEGKIAIRWGGPMALWEKPIPPSRARAAWGFLDDVQYFEVVSGQHGVSPALVGHCWFEMGPDMFRALPAIGGIVHCHGSFVAEIYAYNGLNNTVTWILIPLFSLYLPFKITSYYRLIMIPTGSPEVYVQPWLVSIGHSQVYTQTHNYERWIKFWKWWDKLK